MARASSEMTTAISWTSGASNVAAIPIACGKTVATPARATPWSASFHHSYRGTPRRGIAAAWFVSWETFSSTVMRETRSRARASKERPGSR